ASSEAAKLLANKENAADLVGGVSYSGDDLLTITLLDMSLSATMEASRNVAEHVLDRLYQVGELHKDNVQHAGFAVLKAPDIPGMLVETAYISNVDEEVKLGTPNFQEQLATAILSGVKEYFYRRPPVGSRVAQLANSFGGNESN
ncbi:hypothetical protein TI04_06760, partial [Achromatium sp. WMS2]